MKVYAIQAINLGVEKPEVCDDNEILFLLENGKLFRSGVVRPVDDFSRVEGLLGDILKKPGVSELYLPVEMPNMVKPEDIIEEHKVELFMYLYDSGKRISKTDIANLLGVSKDMAMAVLNELISQKIIVKEYSWWRITEQGHTILANYVKEFYD